MNYADFEYHITEKYGIVCENWPLSTFGAPGSMSSLKELEILYDGWVTGLTTFRKLSPDEHQAFKEARMHQRVQAAAQASIQIYSAPSQSSRHSEPSEQPEAGPSSMSMSPSVLSAYSTPAEIPSPISPNMMIVERESVSSPAPPQIHDDLRDSAGPSGMADSPIMDSDDPSVTVYPSESISSPPIQSDGPPTRFIFQHPPGMPVVPYYSMAEAGPSQFTFKLSTGKRPAPNSFNVLGPFELAPKKPRKKRADAGVKRGPNKRTLAKSGSDVNPESQAEQTPAATLVYPAPDMHQPTTDVQQPPVEPS